MLGTSPEFEMALFTVGLILSGGESLDDGIPIQLGLEDNSWNLKLLIHCKNGRFEPILINITSTIIITNKRTDTITLPLLKLQTQKSFQGKTLVEIIF